MPIYDIYVYMAYACIYVIYSMYTLQIRPFAYILLSPE